MWVFLKLLFLFIVRYVNGRGGGGKLVEMQQQVNMFLQLCSCDDIVGCYNNRYEQVYPRLKCKSKVK